jgi:hypothetical protein
MDGRHGPLRLKLDAYHRTHGPLDETHHVFHQASDVGRLSLQFLLSCKGQEPLR